MSILDPINKELNSDMFDGDKIKSKVKVEIVSKFKTWFVRMGYNFDLVKKVVVIGSSIGYQYDKSSDIDVNIVTNLKQSIVDKLFKLLPNGTNLKGTKQPINFYLTTDDSNIKKADNAYDLGKNKWIKKSKKENVDIPYPYVLEIAKFFMVGIDDRIAEYERDKIELALYKNHLENEKLEMNKDDLQDKITEKENEVRADLDAIYVAHKMVWGFRKEAFEGKESEFLIDIKSKKENFSVNNVIYKMMERFGYFEKLLKYEKIRDKMLRKNK